MRMKQANNLKLYNFMNIMSKFKQVLNFLSIKNIFMVLPTFNSVLAKIKTKKCEITQHKKMFNNIIKKYLQCTLMTFILTETELKAFLYLNHYFCQRQNIITLFFC